jgi:hypothetical protein
MWPFKPLEPFVTLLVQPEIDLDRLVQYLFARIVLGLQNFGAGWVMHLHRHSNLGQLCSGLPP